MHVHNQPLCTFREIVVAALIAFLGFHLAISAWSFADAWLTIPIAHSLENGGFGAGPKVFESVQLGTGVGVVSIIAILLGIAFRKLSKRGPWLPLLSFVVTLILVSINWSAAQLSAFASMTHWVFWIFGALVCIVFLLMSWRTTGLPTVQ